MDGNCVLLSGAPPQDREPPIDSGHQAERKAESLSNVFFVDPTRLTSSDSRRAVSVSTPLAVTFAGLYTSSSFVGQKLSPFHQ